MKKALILLLTCIFVFASPGCAPPADPPSGIKVFDSEEETPASPAPTSTPTPTPVPTLSPGEIEQNFIDNYIENMSEEERVSQLFVLAPRTDAEDWLSGPGDSLQSFIQETQAGGYVLFAENISDTVGTQAFNAAIIADSLTPPFLGIDEEGGQVSRLSTAGLEGYDRPATAREIAQGEDAQAAYDAGAYIGGTLADLGFNLDFAPDADVLTNPDNTVIGNRSFGSDPQTVADMASAQQQGLMDQGLSTSPKHFPGHGSTVGDTHEGAATTDLSAEELEAFCYPPFIQCIQDGAAFVMVGHIIAPNADESGLPASLSPYFVTDVLRNGIGFDGIIITDSMQMGAITENYAPDEAAVLALRAGVDMLLMPEDFSAAKEGVLQAVQNDELSPERLRASLTRILKTKIGAGLLDTE